MNKAELIAAVAEKAGLSKKDTAVHAEQDGAERCRPDDGSRHGGVYPVYFQ